ncbi:MAG: ABC transporter ATP-binding protein [Gemmatimonadaceae bacterium]
MGVRGRANGVVSPDESGGEPALELRGVAKRFGDVTAVEDVDLAVSPGSVHALLGENGAGKTTLMRLAYGLIRADAGEIRLFGRQAREHSVQQAVRAGVGMVHQHLSLVPSLTAAENLVLGAHGIYRPRSAEALLRATSESSGLRVPHDALARDLSVVEQQRLEILKALARGARLLILDEPTAVLAPPDIDELLRWIRDFVAQGGSVVLVTHKLREALAIADQVTVLRRGRVTFAGTANESSEEELSRAIFPDKLDNTVSAPSVAPGASVVQADRINVADARGAQRIRGASFQLHRGEIIGLAAIEGSGHRELLAALSALRPTWSGKLLLPPRIALIPADRAREALIPEFTLAENVALHQVGRRRGLLDWDALATRTAALLQRFAIVAPSPSVPARTLSGGNQQRLVVARELEHEVDLIVADNPTRGLDVRATAFVQEQLRSAAARGAAVVFHSSDLDELLSIATRVLVVFHGEVRETGLDRDQVGRAMLGASEAA